MGLRDRTPLPADERTKIIELEADCIGVLARMEARGIAFDHAKLSAIGEELAAKIRLAEEEIYETVGEKFNINSAKQVQEILYERLGLPKGKKIKTGYSVDNEILSELAPSYAIAGMILEHRGMSKLLGTYVDGLGKYVCRGRIHTSYRALGASTGRLASDSPNLQNIPAGEGYPDAIKSCFTSSGAGTSLVVADYSQMELRILASLSGDEGLIGAFESGEDIHARTGRFLFGEDRVITSELRRIAKSVNFGVIYGITGFGLAKTLGTNPREADRYIQTFYRTYPEVRAYYDRLLESAHALGYVATHFGRRRYLPTINDSNRMIRERTEREAMNAPIQGTSADVVKYAMVRLDRELSKTDYGHLLMQVHDELVFEIRDDRLDEARALIREAMETVFPGRVRLTVDMGTGKNWCEAKH
jgi:DNA polymerase I